MAKAAKFWILLADGDHARVLRSDGPGLPLAEIHTWTGATSGEKAGDLTTDRPGRVAETGKPGQGHGYEPKTDAHEQAEIAFLRDVATKINTAARDGMMQRLVIAAAPTALGRLRDALDDHARKLLAAEVAKDYIHEKPDTVRKRLENQVLI